jgi:hypothetical protein
MKRSMLCLLTPVRNASISKEGYVSRPMSQHPAVIKARKAAVYSLLNSGVQDRQLIKDMVKEISSDFSMSTIDGCKAAITKGQCIC